MEKPTVYVRDSARRTIGEIDDYTQLTLTVRHNDVGVWVLDLSASSDKVALLDPHANPGGGIVVMRGDAALLTGPTRAFAWSANADSGPGQVTISGPDDNAWLAGRLVYPTPGQFANAQTDDFYEHASANAETIMRDLVHLNAGLAALAERAVPGLVLEPVNAGRGRVHVPAKMRFTSLLTELQAESVVSQVGGDRTTALSFRVVQVGTALQFQVYNSADRIRTATFGFALGNLSSAAYTATAPTATVALLGSGAQAAASGAIISASVAEYIRPDTVYPGRTEQFVEAGQLDATGGADELQRLDDQADTALDQAGGQVGLTLAPIDTERLQFGRDYFLGDWVTVTTPYVNLQERVQQIGLSWSAESGEGVAVAAGTQDGQFTIPTGAATRAVGPPSAQARAAAATVRVRSLWSAQAAKKATKPLVRRPGGDVR